MDLMYEVPSEEDVVACRITKECVEDGAAPELTRTEEGRKPVARKHTKKNNHGGEIA